METTAQPHPEPSKAALSSAETEASQREIFKKNAWRLLPLLGIAYVVSYLDRSNIGFAALTMRKDLGISATQLGWGAGLFFIGYSCFEVPSNLAMYHVGARKWLARIMLTWGIVACASAFVVGVKSFYVSRILLGIAEAGFFPGVIYYLTLWFPAKYRTQVLAWFMVAIPISSLVGGPISGYLLEVSGWGFKGWQWMFIVEGLPACVLGIVTYLVLKNEPKEAQWLSARETEELTAELKNEKRERAHASLSAALKDPRLLILAGISLGYTSGSTGVGIWLPQILKDYHLSNIKVGLLSAIPYFFATIGMLIWARHVDKTMRRVKNMVLACALSAVAFAVSLMFKGLTPSLGFFTLALIGTNAARAIFFAIPSRFLTGAAVAGGLGFVNAVGAFGGFVGPFIVGWLRDTTGSFVAGMLAMAGMLVLATVLSYSLHRYVHD